MAPKRNGKDGERASGKRARTSEGKGKGKEPVVSEGITERQLASFSQVSAEAANSSRLLHKNSQSGLNSLLAAAGAHSGSHQHSSNVLGEYKAALHLLHLQQGSMHAFPSGLSPHAIGSAPPTGIPMPLGTVPEMKGLSGDTVRALQLDGTASVPSLRAMLQPGTFDANTMQALLSAQIAAQNSGQTVLQLPHYTLQPGTSALPSMVTLESQHGAGVPYPNTFVAINAINIDTAPDQASKQGSTSSASARPEAKSDVGGAARSHGPSADRYLALPFPSPPQSACVLSSGAAQDSHAPRTLTHHVTLVCTGTRIGGRRTRSWRSRKA